MVVEPFVPLGNGRHTAHLRKFVTYEHGQSILSACHLSLLSARQISTSRYHSSLGEGAGTQTCITHTDVLHLPKSARTLSQGVGICTTSFGSVSITFSRMSKIIGAILYLRDFCYTTRLIAVLSGVLHSYQ